MATYVYKAKKDTAETVTGQIQANSQEEAVDLINQLGFLPVSVVPAEEVASSQSSSSRFPRRIKTKELYVFSRQLANLLRSGVSILRSLNIISEQTENKYFRSVILQIAQEVKNGKSFSNSLRVYPKIFSSLYVTLVHAGEESGRLQEMLLNIAIYQKKQAEIISKVRTAMAYPILMAVVGVITVYFVLTFVLPKMAGLFDSIGEALPLPTVILMKVSGILSQWWLPVLLGLGGLFVLLRLWALSASGRAALSKIVLHLPLFGHVILRTELSRFSRTLVLLLEGGVSIVKALDISIPILSNDIIKAHLTRCKTTLTAGGSFGESMRKSNEIPAMMGHLISVGEESGNLAEVLAEIADTYEQETNEQIKVMTTLLEPLMILVIGLVIGFIVFAMLLPIFQVDVLSR